MRTVRRTHARTIRLRLTALYGVVFLITGAILLTIGYLLVHHNLLERQPLRHQAERQLGTSLYRDLYGPPHSPPTDPALKRAFDLAYAQAANNALHRLLLEYIGALVVMTGVSVAAGWLLAGRALAPLRAITTTAQRVSGENLGERIALQGPDDELKRLADTFDRMLGRLDSAFASQRHFVANASHELRTPLAIMRTEIDVALADPEASVEELRAMGEAVRETIDRSESLIAALLVLARSEGATIREQPVDLTELVADCVSDARAEAELASIAIETDIEPATASGDQALLQRVCANLIQNGIRHNHPHGSVRVRTATIQKPDEPPTVEVIVENSGAVIGPDRVAELTEPFRRLTRTAGGFGLGLSIVRSIVEAHHGQLELTGREAGGLRVRVVLPAEPGETGKVTVVRRARSLTKS